MNRRDFLHLAGLSGLSLMVPQQVQRSFAAGKSSGPSQLWVFVHASGGWDPTLLCDPKGRAGPEDPAPINAYEQAAIVKAGNLLCAPVPAVQAFFTKRNQQLLVVNGIDTQTNSHDAGTRFAWSGRLSEGWPCLAALIAAQSAPDKALAFVSYGGYDTTAGVAPLTRLGSPQTLAAIAAPDSLEPGKPARFHTLATSERIEAAQRARLQALQKRPVAPRAIDNAAALYALHASDSDLAKLMAALPTALSNDPLQRQAQMILAAFQSGLSVSGHMVRGGFDTHGDHDAKHIPAMESLIQGVEFLLSQAELLGLADRLTVVVGSDFGRTPGYNSGKGKDHWSVSSALLIGKGVVGNRVVGASTAGFKARTVNPKTLALQEGGIRLTHGSLHRSLRALAGIEGTDLAARFPIAEPLLPLLG